MQVDGRVVNLGAKAIVTVQRGDRIRLLTPGGGGYGDPSQGPPADGEGPDTHYSVPRVSGSVAQYRALQESA